MIVDLSKNEVFGACPASVFADAARATGASANLYPNGLREAVEAEVADRWAMPRGSVMLTRGVDDATDVFINTFRGRRFFTIVPGFDGYPQRLASLQAPAATIEWPIDSPALQPDGHLSSAAALLVASPGNPCGRALPDDYIDRVSSSGAVVLLDHAYFDFTPAARAGATYSDVVRRLSSPKVFHYFSFSKAWALAGLRLGVLVGSDEKLLTDMRRVQAYQIVDTFALHVLLGAVAAGGYASRLARAAVDERDWLAAQLVSRGRPPISREGNFVSLRDAGLGDAMRAAGIRVRDLKSFGLPGWLRIGAPPPDARGLLLGAIEAAR